jgi:hypothetical protein
MPATSACLHRTGRRLIALRSGAPLRAAAIALALGGLALPPLLAQPAGSSGSIFTCTTAQGRRLTSDRPIPECMDREQREMGPSGAVRRRIAPVQTEEERAADEARQKQQDALRRQQVEATRRDQLLLARYPTLAQHAAERQAALRRTLEVDALARQRIAILEKERDKLRQAQRESSGAGPDAGGVLRQQLLSNAGELDAQQNFLAAQDEERQRINARFDAEMQRLKPLWSAAR